MFCTLDKQKKAGRPWNPGRGGRKQPGDITDEVSIASAGTSMLSDFEPPATSQPTERDAATARELRTRLVRLTRHLRLHSTKHFVL